MSGHTPGPWGIELAADGTASINGFGWYGLASVIVKMAYRSEPDPTGEANARLIAAAPELLAACRSMQMLRQVGGVLPGVREILNTVLEQADAAIAKAEGTC